MSKHRYAFVTADNKIIHMTEPLSEAPPPMTLHGARLICQQIASDHAAIPREAQHHGGIHSDEYVKLAKMHEYLLAVASGTDRRSMQRY
jgi:hypothetical protein